MIRALVLLLTIIVLGAPSAFVCIPLAALTGNVLPLYNAALFIVRIGYRLVGIRVEVHGRENVPPKTACIFMANHVSNLDPPALLPRIPGRTSAFVKKSLMKIPVFGWALKLGEFVPVSRDAASSAHRRASPLPAASSKEACTSLPSLKALAHWTAACCPSRRARFIWPCRPACRASRFPSTEPRP
jgi:1-acyl-sn-glycerol-3-phosphate acyltransferase